MLLLPLYKLPHKSHNQKMLWPKLIIDELGNLKRAWIEHKKKLIHISQSALITQILSRGKARKKAISLLDSRASNRKF